MLQMQLRELHVHFTFLSTFHVARGILRYTSIIITEFECENAFDFMYKFLRNILHIKVFSPILKVAD